MINNFINNFLKKIDIQEKNIIRKSFIIGVLFFVLYFILGCIYSYYIYSIGKYNLFFGTDTPRVIIDLTQRVGNHTRTSVHPLFVISFQPFVQLFNVFLKNKILSSILLQSLVSGVSMIFIYLSLNKLKLDAKIKNLLFFICAFSFSNIVFNCTIETYSFAQLFIIILFYYALCNKNKIINNFDITILVLLGIANLGVTITNYAIYLLVLVYLIIFNDKLEKSKKIFILFVTVLLSVTISITISEMQALVFSESSLFFKENLYGLLSGSPNELKYVESFSMVSVINQIKSVFVYGFYAPKITLTQDVHNLILTFGNMYLFQKIFFFIMIIVMVLGIIIFLKNNLKKILNHKFLILLVLTFSFNFLLHTFYGNSESFLYTLHYQFILVLIFAYILQFILDSFNKKTNIMVIKFVVLFLIIFLIVELISNALGLYNIYNLLKNLCGFSKNTSYFVYIIPSISLIFIILLLNTSLKRKLVYSTSLIVLFGVLLFSYSYFNSKNSIVSKENQISYQNYLSQLDLLKKEFNVNVAFENQDTDFYFFGMGNRNKFLYQNGKIYNLDTKEIVYSYEIKKEVIVPNEYLVVLKTIDNKIVKIYENEDSIFIEDENKKINLDENAVKINLPEFEEYKYSEVLKVLHHELLFNISDSVFKPNILVYSDGWYRDAMLGAMVLDISDNVDLIKNWVDNIDKIYDLQNGREEADNLGELLYLLYITGSKNKIKNEIIKEIKTMKKENNNYLVGYTDGRILSYYPTVIAKYALDLSNIDLALDMPSYDYYSSLTWFYNKDVKVTEYYDKINYPYIGWAAYHTNKSGVLYICDSIYPLSYEKNGSYADYSLLPDNITYYKVNQLSPTHVWDAAEKFLFLIEQN